MAKKEVTDEQQVNAAASTVGTTAAGPTTVYDPTDILIDEQTIEDINQQYKENVKTIEEGYKAQEDAVNKAYGTQLGGYANFLDEVTRQKLNLSAQDEEAQRKSNAYRYIAGIGDAISGVANLVGTAKGASNQSQAYNAPGVMAMAEEQRKARKLDMDKLDARMNELKAQRTTVESARDLKLGELRGQKASDLATAELKRLQGVGDMKAANTKAKASLAVQGMKNEAQKNKKSSASKPGEEYTFYGKDGNPTVIPGHKWNKEAALKAYSLIPEERRTKRQKYDRFGDPIKDAYQSPSMSDILYDIGVEVETNEKLQEYLAALAKGGIFASL